ncbi:MAG: group II intron maturase-specific domain-containing protein [Planctomycetaceae bacterium]
MDGLLWIASQLKLFDKLDQWIRRRIRMCYWKRWRHNARTRRRELIRLGVPRRQAIRHAKSRKGPLAYGKEHSHRKPPNADPHVRWCGEGHRRR